MEGGGTKPDVMTPSDDFDDTVTSAEMTIHSRLRPSGTRMCSRFQGNNIGRDLL